jgi:hypothetical protein
VSVDTDLLGLTSFRTQISKMIRDGLDESISVSDAIPDSITPPAVYVAWANPWMIGSTWCEYTTLLQLIVVAQRIEPGGQYGILESLVGEILAILRTNRVALRDVNSPYPISLGGVVYLACSINLITEMGD